jgi:hypothetical protein
MSNQLVPLGKPSRDGLHPAIYVTIVCLVAWFVLSVWILFGASSYESVTDGVITGFFIMVTGIPAAIWLTWRNHPEAHPYERTAPGEGSPPGNARLSFRRWASGSFETWTGQQRAWQAAIEILLPIMAVAFGITAFGLVYYLTLATTA